MNKLQKFLDGMVDSLRRFAAAVESIVSRFFSGLLRFLEDTYNWLINTARPIADYLARFFPALANVFFFALIKLSLFYVPSAAFCCWTIFFDGSPIWAIVGIAWAVFITGIGLTYGKKSASSIGKRLQRIGLESGGRERNHFPDLRNGKVQGVELSPIG
jgi:hypothetical protein